MIAQELGHGMVRGEVADVNRIVRGRVRNDRGDCRCQLDYEKWVALVTERVSAALLQAKKPQVVRLGRLRPISRSRPRAAEPVVRLRGLTSRCEAGHDTARS